MINSVNQFFFRGKRSYDDMGLIITDAPAFTSPERDIIFTGVNGRNGDIITDNKRFKNIEASYKVAGVSNIFNMSQIARKIKCWLQSDAGYYLLSDTYDPNYFRYACYVGKINIENKLQLLGGATLKFNCKPFKYRVEGRREISISTPQKIYNPEDWESLPYIKIVGHGDITLAINNNSFIFHSVEDYIEIDSELQIAFKGTELQNNKTAFVFPPVLSPGCNDISFSGQVNEIKITPRWCCL